MDDNIGSAVLACAAGSGRLCGAIATLCLERWLVLGAPAFLMEKCNEQI